MQAAGQLFLTVTEAFSLTHPLDLLGYFTEAISIPSWSLPSKKHQATGQKSFTCLVRTLLWVTACCFLGFGNLMAHNVHGDRADKAPISHLLRLKSTCHSQPTLYESFPPLVWEATWGPQFERGRSTRYVLRLWFIIKQALRLNWEFCQTTLYVRTGTRRNTCVVSPWKLETSLGCRLPRQEIFFYIMSSFFIRRSG